MAIDLASIISDLRKHPSIMAKLSIGKTASMLNLSQYGAGRPGDDCAVIQRGINESKTGACGASDGFELLAGEGFIPAFVNDDPWFAGWCGIMVNVSDIAAMGGTAVGIVNQIWAKNCDQAAPLLQGMKDASIAYNVPILGGHTNFNGSELNLAVSIFGRAHALMTSFDAQPGDVLIAAIDLRGQYRNFDNFFAAGDAPHQRLRDDLQILPHLAESGLVKAGKDISQGGIAGTALMLAECSGVGIHLDLDALIPPSNIPIARWLRSFPSFGFLLAVAPENADVVCDLFCARDISAQVIGECDDSSHVTMQANGQTQEFWDYQNQPYLDLGKKQHQKELCDA